MLNWPPPEMAEFRDETAAWRAERKSRPSTSFSAIHHDHRSHLVDQDGSSGSDRVLAGVRSSLPLRSGSLKAFLDLVPVFLTHVLEECLESINLFRSRDSSKKFGLHASQLSKIHLPVWCRAGTSPYAGLPKNPDPRKNILCFVPSAWIK